MAKLDQKRATHIDVSALVSSHNLTVDKQTEKHASLQVDCDSYTETTDLGILVPHIAHGARIDQSVGGAN